MDPSAVRRVTEEWKLARRVDVFDRNIRAVVDRHAGIHERAPEVGPLAGAHVAQAKGDPGSVRGGVHALHRREDAEVGEARDVVGMDVLRVLDPPAEVIVGAGRVEDGLVDVQDFAVRAVPDGVRVDLETVLDRDVRGPGDVLDRFEHEARPIRACPRTAQATTHRATRAPRRSAA